MAMEGHDVANHSYSHFRMGSLGSEMQSSEIKKCGDAIERITGQKCDLFRAPYGDYNNSSSRKPASSAILRSSGTSIHWTGNQA